MAAMRTAVCQVEIGIGKWRIEGGGGGEGTGICKIPNEHHGDSVSVETRNRASKLRTDTAWWRLMPKDILRRAIEGGGE